ncbi:MAG: hypothetical protein RR938_09295, partial [Muribaculaceae bacterium]
NCGVTSYPTDKNVEDVPLRPRPSHNSQLPITHSFLGLMNLTYNLFRDEQIIRLDLLAITQ